LPRLRARPSCLDRPRKSPAQGGASGQEKEWGERLAFSAQAPERRRFRQALLSPIMAILPAKAMGIWSHARPAENSPVAARHQGN